MFSLQIVDTDAFLEMPVSSQLLYFHFSMRADDEGFVNNPKKIMKLVGVAEDDMKVLKAKRFILTFESGIVVIKHWLIHNAIRADRFNKTVYDDEKKLLTIKENKAYTESGCQNGNQPATQYRLDKISLDNISFEKFWNAYDKKVGRPKSEKKWYKLSLKDQGAIMAYIPNYKKAQPDKKYRKNPETFFNNRSWEDELIKANDRGEVKTLRDGSKARKVNGVWVDAHDINIKINLQYYPELTK